MVETIIRLLITICLLVLCAFLVVWVLGELGIILPAIVYTIGKIILVLVIILIAYRALKGSLPGWLP